MMSINYVAYLILVLPLILLYYFITNPIRRRSNQRKLRKILQKGGVSKELRKEVLGSYKNFTKIFSISRILKQRGESDKKLDLKGLVNVR
ncbi:MAG: hypothetical protein HeimAB125_13710 [Candidatus Heimdallarchaeota archaeon AB_125]|nr:MAG: hypothetical protein HeimAB125_13710 [Candidatus Heimdallarchaeota archaeon AB_125]